MLRFHYCSVPGTIQTAADPKVFTLGCGGGGEGWGGGRGREEHKGLPLRWDYFSNELTQL